MYGVFQRFGGRGQIINDNNHNTVCRTALATTGLLNLDIVSLSVKVPPRANVGGRASVN